MNSVQIMGNLTRDPQMRATKTGRAVASFSVAVNRTYSAPNGEQRELTDFVNVVAWGSLAEAVGNQLKKGTRVFVEGRYSSRSYETQDGQKRYVTEVTANLIALPIGMQHSAQPAQDMGGYAQPSGFSQSRGNFNQFGTSRTDEDIPF
jgi:single-strand binding protein